MILAAVVLCGSVFLIVVFEGDGDFAPGGCPSGFGWWGAGGGGLLEGEGPGGEVERFLENANFEASSAAARDLGAGIVDPRLVDTLRTITEEHRICVDAFKEGHHFLPGVTDGPLIPDGYGEVGGLPNTHYHGRAADVREVDGEPVRGNGADPNVLNVGRIIAGIPPRQRPDQIIGPRAWAEALNRSDREGWILDEDQMELHEDHLHIGYLSEGSSSNAE